MRGTGMRRVALAAVSALILSAILSAPAAAASGWLDPTFSGNGWLRLEASAFAPEGIQDVIVSAGPNGRVAVARYRADGDASELDGIMLTAAGTVSPAFNDGEWLSVSVVSDGGSLAGFFATAGGGFVGAHYGEFARSIRIREASAAGDVVRQGGVTLDGDSAGSGRLLRLPGGSYRTCYHSGIDETDVLLGFTSTLQLDPAVGPNGRRAIDVGCNLVGHDTSGHLYFAQGGPGSGGGPLELWRTTTSGSVDMAWADGGMTLVQRGGITIDLPLAGHPHQPSRTSLDGAHAPMTVLADGSILLAARATRDLVSDRWSAAIVKLTPDGEMDASFGSGGVRAFGPAGGQSRLVAMAVDASGRAVVSAVYNFPDGRTRSFLARLTPTGGFDTSFGRAGLIQQTFTASSIAIDSAGRILTAAWDINQETIIVARRKG